MPQRLLLRRHRFGFTLIELLVVILIISILASIAIPLVSKYIDQTNKAAAETSLNGAQRAVDAYQVQNASWPASLTTPNLFTNGDPFNLPTGYSLQYDSLTGVVTLVTP
jgi:prepilin-type N-terminal cleavage/methylation domain-containing protein